tara:strand:+ start:662 stop:898 length:237 start_codon:yes stop_codon:yes gene_type:complete
MNYEFKDFRNKEPYDPPNWLDWQPDNPLKYLILIVFFILGIPFLFGYILTPLGTLTQLLIIDYWLYLREQSTKINFDE